MDAILNLFSPGAGSPPAEFVEREDLLRQAEVLLRRARAGRSEKASFLPVYAAWKNGIAERKPIRLLFGPS